MSCFPVAVGSQHALPAVPPDTRACGGASRRGARGPVSPAEANNGELRGRGRRGRHPATRPLIEPSNAAVFGSAHRPPRGCGGPAAPATLPVRRRPADVLTEATTTQRPFMGLAGPTMGGRRFAPRPTHAPVPVLPPLGLTALGRGASSRVPAPVGPLSSGRREAGGGFSTHLVSFPVSFPFLLPKEYESCREPNPRRRV